MKIIAQKGIHMSDKKIAVVTGGARGIGKALPWNLQKQEIL